MASTLKTHSKMIKPSRPSTHFSPSRTLFSTIHFPAQKQHCRPTLSCFTRNHYEYSPKVAPVSVQNSLSSSTPPSSKEEAVHQAKTCISKALEKPLNNPRRLTGKLRKTGQRRFRVEIPVIDGDSPASISQLAVDVFGEMPINRRGSPLRILILWPNPTLADAAVKAFEAHSSTNEVQNNTISAATGGETSRILNSSDMAIFLAPVASQLALMRTITEDFIPKPVVVFNPRWGFEEEDDFGELRDFVGSFEVVYSFAGLEVRGIIGKKKGVIFKCVTDGAFGGERWEVLVEEEGDMKVVSKFKARPSIGEVENVLYNKMAINSPLTKSAKLLKDFVSNVTSKR